MKKDERTVMYDENGYPQPRPSRCPACGSERQHGTLRTPGHLDSHVFVDMKSDSSDRREVYHLDLWICKHCGNLEFQVNAIEEELDADDY